MRWQGDWRWALTATFEPQSMWISWWEKRRLSITVRWWPSKPASLAIVPIEVLIYMKLAAKRRRDLVDVIELVKVGADVNRVRDYLKQYASDLGPSFEELVNEALGE